MFLNQLLTALEATRGSRRGGRAATAAAPWDPWRAELKRLSAQLEEREIGKNAELKTLPGRNGEKGLCNAVRILQQLDEKLPEKTILIGDGGDFVGTAAYVLRPRAAFSWLDPGPFGTLGVGGGFALGASLLFPDHKIVIIYGDGAAGYSLLEYDTFVRKNRNNILSIIGNDACWTQIEREQTVRLKSDVACPLSYSDYHKMVEAFGAEGALVRAEEDFGPKVDLALRGGDGGKPFCLNVLIGKSSFREGSISI